MDRNKIIKIVAIVVIGIGALIYYFLNQKNDYEEINIEFAQINSTKSEQVVEKELIKVYITGEIVNPGVFEVEEGSRIDDIVKKAGGFTEFADLTDTNLAYEISDGEKIYIPNINEENESVDVDTVKNNTNVNSKININKANINELTNIPSIGSSTAEKIIEYREKNGKFSSVEDIKNVSGIGESKFNKIKDYISVK